MQNGRLVEEYRSIDLDNIGIENEPIEGALCDGEVEEEQCCY